MPVEARRAMLRGIENNTIIVGAYADSSIGGVCPMLAAHRSGGRISLASFARSWDRYTDADGKRPRRATTRELRTLTALLEASLIEDGVFEAERDEDGSLTQIEPAASSVPAFQAEREWADFTVRRKPTGSAAERFLSVK